MPLHLKLLNLDEVFSKAYNPVIINELPNLTTEDRERFTALVREIYTSDMVSVMPKCACPGDEGLHGEHLIGEVCDICNTPVKQLIEDDITPRLWFRKPKSVKALVNPIIWIMLNQRFSKSKFRVLQWLTDRHYGSNSGLKTPEIVYKLTAEGIPRGYNAFVENFDEIIRFLFSLKDFQDKKGATKSIIDMLGITHPSKDPLQQLIHDHRGSIFCDHIPLLNKTLLVTEKTAMGYDYGESTMFSMVNVTNTMLSIDRDYHDKNPLSVENRTARIHAMLGDYYVDFFKKNVAPKEGLIRKQVYSGRGNHGFRAVITSHEDMHDHDEIHIPWCIAVTVWRQHLLNRLMSNHPEYGGYTLNKAVGLLMSHVYKYHAQLDQIFKEFISGSWNGRGPCCLTQRNPTLMQGSAQRTYITRVKTNPEDMTVSISDLICTAMNADYDGDEIMFTLALDKKMERMFYPFSPFFNLLPLNKPLEIGRNATMTDSIIASTSEWIEAQRRLTRHTG